MSENEEEAHELTSGCLELFKKLIDKHRGVFIKSTGDGVMVEFNSVTDAVFYGIDIQKQLKEHVKHVPEDRRPVFRIGVHLGEIMHEGGDVYGHSVNVAARIEQFANRIRSLQCRLLDEPNRRWSRPARSAADEPCVSRRTMICSTMSLG